MTKQKPFRKNSVGARLRFVRGELTQDVFAYRLGTEKNTIGRYERGERQPDSLFLKKLQTEFHVSVDWLLGGMGEPYLSTPDPTPASETLDIALLMMILTEVLEWIFERDRTVNGQQLGERIVTVYNDIQRVVGHGYTPEVPRALLKMAMLQWEREHQEKATESQ